ncbi:MAG: EAL domain-containing protein [Acidaminococcaceae bacterium]
MAAKILLINESTEECANIKEILTDFDVLSANSTLEALKILTTDDEIELALIDLALPNNEAFRIITEIKKNDLNKKIRIVILTQNEQIGEEAKALRCGAGDYVRKPFSPAGLHARLNVQLEILRQQKYSDYDEEERDFIFKTIFEQSPLGILVSRSANPSTNAYDFSYETNPMYEKITGHKQAEFDKLKWPAITHPEDLAGCFEKFRQLQEGLISDYTIEKRYVRPDGSIVWANLAVAAIRHGDGKKAGDHLCLVQDITEKKVAEAALAESERSKSVLLSHLPGMAYRCRYDRDWTMEFVSEGCYELTGYRPESLLNNEELSFNDIIAPEYREVLWQQWANNLHKQQSFKYEYEIITASGERKWVLEMGQGIYDDSGNVEALEGIIIDITDRKKYELELAYSGGHDRSTGLYNYCSLQSFMESDKLKNESLKKAIILLKLNKMSAINSTYGYSFTEKVVKDIANKLAAFVSKSRLLFRVFSDKLVFYYTDYDSRQELEFFCESVIDTLNKTQIMQVIGCGIGVAELAKYDFDTNNAIINASEAAKRANENSVFGYYFVDDKLIEAISRTAKIQNNLIAIANETVKSNIFLEYQPILSLKDNTVDGFEALARMQSEKLGRIEPLEFISLAEKMQLIVPIGLQIMRKACTFLRRLQLSGYSKTTVGVNISAIQFFRAEFVDDIIRIINETEVDASRVCIEITESIFLGNYEEINAKLAVLQKIGIKVAIDDFGVGYSSLAREGELNIDYLKIDKVFIDKLMRVTLDKAIAGDIIAIAHRRGHRVVAEGIEHELQVQYLAKHHCDYIQGYYFSKPLPEEDAFALLAKTNSATC